jgi:hypothetical protein
VVQAVGRLVREVVDHGSWMSGVTAGTLGHLTALLAHIVCRWVLRGHQGVHEQTLHPTSRASSSWLPRGAAQSYWTAINYAVMLISLFSGLV